MNYTLQEWQTILKPVQDMIVQASSTNCDDGWQPFPIGMSYRFSSVATIPEAYQLGTHENLVLCAISPETDQRRRGSTLIYRKSILKLLEKNGIMNTHIHEYGYFTSLPSYKFIISPEGNGIDCHRHYEALMAGCIPIVEHHEGIEEKYKGCPILYTTNYSEITEEYLENVYSNMLTTTYDFSCLFLSKYPESVQSTIRHAGNFWMERLGKGTWYVT